jgi:hypothetical protein
LLAKQRVVEIAFSGEEFVGQCAEIAQLPDHKTIYRLYEYEGLGGIIQELFAVLFLKGTCRGRE